MRAGITYVELIVVTALILTLTTLATINLLGAKHKASMESTITPLIADLKQQQLKSMIGDTEGQTNSASYGIYFSSSSYTLFRDTYSPANPENLEIKLGDNIDVVNPNYSISFSEGNGEIGNATSVILQNTLTGEQKTINLNKYGAITSVN